MVNSSDRLIQSLRRVLIRHGYCGEDLETKATSEYWDYIFLCYVEHNPPANNSEDYLIIETIIEDYHRLIADVVDHYQQRA